MKIFLTTLLIIIVAIGLLVLDTVRDAGEFKNIDSHFAGSVQKISGVVGAEDIIIHHQAGVAYISCDDRRATLSGQESQGSIYSYDLNSDPSVLMDLTRDFEIEFHPHGISLFISADGIARLFAVNHRREGHFVEIFQIGRRGEQLVHLESISGKLMHSPNDLVAVAPRNFYVTNDHGSVSGFGRTLEEYLRLAKANVLYFDGSNFKVAAQNILYANGINVNPDGSKIYVAATTAGEVLVFDRNITNNALELVDSVELGTGVDNIELDQDGNLWIAGHPKLLTFVEHAKNANKLSPSQVIKITLTNSGDFQVDEIFMDTGVTLSGSSVATVYGEKLLIGSVFEKHFLLADLSNRTMK